MAVNRRHRARKMAQSLAQGATNKRQRIDVSLGARTLKRSARRQLERERAPSLWIMPWVDLKQHGSMSGRVHPKASLLGLPSELRQQILYKSYSLKELKDDARKYYRKPIKSRKVMIPARMDTDMLNKFGLSSKEGDLIPIISRRVGIHCRTSPLIRQDMDYVCKRLQVDLEKLFDRELPFRLDKPKVPRILEGMEWLRTPSIAAAPHLHEQQNVINGKKRKAKKNRPRKCWHCLGRHYGIDPVCPMAREDPRKWRQMTRKLGGRRGGQAVKSITESRKIIFDDAWVGVAR